MKKYLNKRFAKKAMLRGGITYASCVVLNLIITFTIYGNLNRCVNESATCTFKTRLDIAQIAVYVGYAGLAVAAFGLALWLLLSTKKKV